MPIIIKIADTPHRLVIEGDDLSLKQVKEKVAEALGVETLEAIKIDINSTKKDIVINGHIEDRTLRGDYNLIGDASVTVRTTIPSAPTLKEKTTLEIAQKGLRRAITEAQAQGSHVIVTVGSCLQRHGGDVTALLLKQQFPVEHLGPIDENAAIHFIHVDPAFAKPVPGVKQMHEQEGWQLVSANAPISVYKHSSKPYRVTTIAAPISNTDEVSAYFSAGRKATTLLGVSLHEYALTARSNRTGFITGNFYAEKAVPVISIPPSKAPVSETGETVRAEPIEQKSGLKGA